MKASFTTLGCKVNQYESQAILDSFEHAGFEIVPFDTPADVVVINSCSVTCDADRKSRYTIRRARRISPDAAIVVTGCSAQAAINRSEGLDGADLIVPNPEKLETLGHVARSFPELIARAAQQRHERPRTPSGRVRATLKVQDGCNVMCSYCSIPFTRPVMVSRPAEQVLAEAQRLAEMGYHEAILTGVLIGSYGPETGSGGPYLTDLARLLARESGLTRLRLSSVEMQQVTPELIELVEQGILVPHLHIPLQSGDTDTLRDMNRPYAQQDYLKLIERIRARIPGITLTTDIIVGFPTETEERFQSTLEVVRQAEFFQAHVFTFSPRQGTPAAQWGDPISAEEKAERRRRVTDAVAPHTERKLFSAVGRVLRVIIEGKATRDGLLQGISDEYFTVSTSGSANDLRSVREVRVGSVAGGVLVGEIVSPVAGLPMRP